MAIQSQSLYQFTVLYERTRRDGTVLEGSTIVSAQRSNFGLAGAIDKLRDRFASTSTEDIKAVKIVPYLSGSAIIKQRRADRRNR